MTHNNVEGVLLGHAVGDAFGLPVEFADPDEIADEFGYLDSLIGNRTWSQPIGRVSDDTDMALCLARSLAQQGAFDPDDVAQQFLDWHRSRPVGQGRLTREILDRLNDGAAWSQASKAVWENRPEGQNAGNGGLMRAVPVALAFRDAPEQLITASRWQAAITHWDQRCRDTSAALNLIIAACLDEHPNPVEVARQALPDDCHEEIATVLDRLKTEEPRLEPTGYTIHTLESGVWYGLTRASTRRAITDAVNELGGDTDTIAAVAGAVAGARHGYESLPDSWLYDREGRGSSSLNSKQWGRCTEELRTLARVLDRERFDIIDETPM